MRLHIARQCESSQWRWESQLGLLSFVGAQWVGGQHWYWSRHEEVNRGVWTHTHTLSQHMLWSKSSNTSSSSISQTHMLYTCTHTSQGCHFSVNSSAKQWVTTAVLPQRIFVWVTGFTQHKQTDNATRYKTRQTLCWSTCEASCPEGLFMRRPKKMC